MFRWDQNPPMPPPFALIPCSHGSVFPLPQGSVDPWTRDPCIYVTLHPWTLHPCTHAPLLPSIHAPVDAWVISHPHHDPMPHTHPCRTTTGLTVTLTPVIPITPMTHQLLQPPHGSVLPLTPFYQRNNTNTLPMPPKPTLALAKALYIVTSQSHKWLLERPLLVPRRDRCFAALRSYSQRYAPLYAALGVKLIYHGLGKTAPSAMQCR